jgi:opacity protein-like surface antigen
MRRETRVGWAAAAAAAALLLSARARADETSASRRAAAAREMNRPYTMAELHSGFLALPAAKVYFKPVCQQPTDCGQGEYSLALGFDNLYRFDRFAVGAGIQWATTLRSDPAIGSPDVDRRHSRRYFLFQAQARYYFFRLKSWDFWGGGTVGGVVVNDSWSAKLDREPYADTDLVGPRASTLGTEGLALGIGAGAEWTFAPNWSFCTKLLYSNWIFPQQPETSPAGDVASLSGRVDVFTVGFTIAYRIAL